MNIQSIWGPVILLLGITAIFTIGGGLSAVIYTDTLQTVIMLFGGILVAVISSFKIDGLQNLYSKFLESDVKSLSNPNITCGIMEEENLSVMKSITDEDFPWLGVLTGMTINSLWYWCSDQVIVQRCLSAKSFTEAKAATVLCSFLKISSIFIMLYPGMISRILFPDIVGCIDLESCMKVCGMTRCNDIAYPYLVLKILPNGVIGLLLAVMLSALMSSLTSTFNSASSIITLDIYPKIHAFFKNEAPSENSLMIVSRVAVLSLIAISVAWIPVVQENQTGSLFVYVQMISSYLQPPIAAIYVLGVFFKRANEFGVFWSLIVGLIIGLSRMTIDVFWPRPSCMDMQVSGTIDLRPEITKHFPFLYFSVFLFLTTITICLVLSGMKKSSFKHGKGTTWTTRHYGDDHKIYINGVHHPENFQILCKKQEQLSEKPSLRKFWKNSRVLSFLCGFENEESIGSESYEHESGRDILIENSKWKHLVDIMAVFMAFVSVGLWVWMI